MNVEPEKPGLIDQEVLRPKRKATLKCKEFLKDYRKTAKISVSSVKILISHVIYSKGIIYSPGLVVCGSVLKFKYEVYLDMYISVTKG